MKKLQQCSSVVFDFSDPVSDLKSKELKRSTLNELIDFVASAHGFLNEQTYAELVHVVSANAFRPLPPHDSATEIDPEDDEPNPEPSWPHLQVLSALLLSTYFALIRLTVCPSLAVSIFWAFMFSCVRLWPLMNPFLARLRVDIYVSLRFALTQAIQLRDSVISRKSANSAKREFSFEVKVSVVRCQFTCRNWTSGFGTHKDPLTRKHNETQITCVRTVPSA